MSPSNSLDSDLSGCDIVIGFLGTLEIIFYKFCSVLFGWLQNFYLLSLSYK